MSSSRLELVVDSRSAERHLSRLGGELERLDRRGTAATAMMGKMRLAVGAISAAAGGLGFSRIIRETASFEDAMLGLQAVSGATAKQMIDLEKQARSLGATSAFSAEQAGNAQRYLAMAGFEVNEVMSATPGILKLATAASIDLGRAADIASNILGGFRLEVDQLNRVNDVLAATAAGSNTSVEQLGEALSYAAPIAAAAGVSIEETAAAIGTLSDSGLQASRAGTGVLGFIRQLSNLTPNATAALESYGLTAAQVNIENEGLTVVLDRLRQANINTADSFKIFGSEAGPAAQILASGSDRVREFTGELGNAEGAAERAALIIGSGLTGSMRGFNSMVSESILQLGASGLAGGFGLVVDNATGVLAVYNDMLPEFAEANNLTETQVDRIRMLAGGLDLLKNAAILASGVIATRMVGSLGAATAAKIAAAASAVRYQIAVTTLTGVSARAAAGQVALAGATRGAAGAMALLGGPIGLLVGAGGLMYMFREELGLVRRAAEPTTQRIDNLTDAINRNSVAAVEAGIVNLAAEYFTLGQRAASATAEIERLTAAQENDRQGAQARLQNNMRLRDLREDLAQIVTEQEAAGNAANELRQILSGLGETVVKTTDSTTDLNDTTGDTAAAASGASKEVTSLADAYESLLDRITPNRREARQYARDLGVLNLALASGRMNTTQYMQAMGLLQESFQAAQRESDDLTVAVTDGANEMTREMERFGNAVDDVFVDAFKGAFDSFESFADRLKGAFETLMAELAWAAVKNEIKIQLGMSASGGGISQMLGGGMGGGGLNIGSLAGIGNNIRGLFGGGSAAASGGLYANAATGAAQGGLYGNVATGGVAQGGGMMSGLAAQAGPIAAMYAFASMGNQLLQSSGAYDALGIRTGGRSSEALGQIAPIGGTLIGSALDAIGIGGRKTKTRLDLATTTDANARFEDSISAQGAFGSVGFSEAGSERLSRAFGEDFGAIEQFVSSIAQLDNAIAGFSENASELDAMAEAVRSVEIRGGSAQEIQEQLEGRGRAAIDAMTGEFGRFVQALEGGIEQVVGQAQYAQGAHNVLASAMGRLSLTFETGTEASYGYAVAIADQVGGVQQLAALQSSYYQAFFTDAERAANLQADLTAEFAKYGAQLPETREEFRKMVEAQNLNTEAGQRNYAALLSVAGAFDQLQSSVIGADASIREREQLERQLLQAQGNTFELRALELDQLQPGNRDLQQRIWALQDEQSRLQGLKNAQRERTREIEREAQAMERARNQLAGFSNSISGWLDQLNSTDRGLGSPADQLVAASEAFEEQYQKALTGDRDALGSITQYADRFIEAQKGWSASGDQTNATIDRVAGMLEDLPDRLSAEQFLAKEFSGAINNQTGSLVTAIDLNGDGQISELERIVSSNLSMSDLIGGTLNSLPNAIAASLNPLFDEIDLDTDGLIDWDEFYRAFDGIASDSELRRIFNKLDTDGSGTISRLNLINNNTGKTIPNGVDDLYGAIRSIYNRVNDSTTGVHVSLARNHNATGRANIGASLANAMAARGIGTGGSAYAKGGVFTNSIVSQPTWFNESVMGEAGPEAIMPLTRHTDGSLGVRAEMPMLQFPLLNQTDQSQVMRDLLNENRQLRKELNARLDKIERHGAAAVAVQQAGFNGQINEQKKGNAALGTMASKARLEGAR